MGMPKRPTPPATPQKGTTMDNAKPFTGVKSSPNASDGGEFKKKGDPSALAKDEKGTGLCTHGSKGY